ncbi:MAG: insulinase family protein [Acidobacteriota bacterium]|nr:insulinase family protein [Acidobacteriota bacterium]
MKSLLLLICSAAAFAQTPAVPSSYKSLKYPPLREIQIPKVEETTLANGMKIYLLENHELPLVRGLALVRTGNLFDPADKIGLATITGSLIRSGGTASKSGDQIDEELENIAASVESQIGESYGSVSFSTLKERTDEVLGMFHDVLTGPAFRQDKLELIKTQLRGGIARRNDDAHGISQREFASLVYGPKTSYGWEMQYATLDAVKRDDVVKFYGRYFFPANIILAVQGDFSAADMKSKLDRLFGSWKAEGQSVPPFPAVNPKLARPGIHVATKTDVTQTSLVLGHLGGEFKDKDYPALQVMSDILGGGFQSRLFQKVRTQLGYAYEVSASWGAGYDHPGTFEIESSTKSMSTTETLKAIEAEVQRIRTQEVTEEELNSAKQTVVNGFIFNFDTPSKTLNRLLTYRYYGYPDDFIFQYQKAVLQVTRADILRVAKEYIDPAKFVIVAVGNPKDFGTPLSAMGLPVSNLDLAIAPPARAAANPAAAPGPPQPKGAQVLARMARAMGGEAKLTAVKDMTETGELNLDPAAGALKAAQTQMWVAPGQYREENVLPFGKVITYSDGKTGWVSSPKGLGPLPDAEAGAKGEDVTETYADWQETDGLKFPRKITISQNGRHFADIKVSSVVLNRGLTPEQISKKP